MPMDVLSTLNTNGTGINISELASDLTLAEIAPRKSIVNDRMDKAEMSLSGFDRLRAQFEDLQSALGVAAETSRSTISSDSGAVVLTAEDSDALVNGPTLINVFELATPQVLAFPGFTDLNEPFAAGDLRVDFGAWSDDDPAVFTEDTTKAGANLAIPSGSSLTDVANALSQLDGVSAQVVDVGDGTYTLGVISEFGENNAIQLTATDDATDTSGNTALSALDMSAGLGDLQVQAANDANLSVNGINVRRSSNDIDDVIPGVSFSVVSETLYPATVTVAEDTNSALEAMETLVDAFNSTISLLSELTNRGYDGEAAGELAGDAAANSLTRELDRMLSRGVAGYGDRTFYMSDLGVRTERDGTLTLDSDDFSEAMLNNPEALDALLKDKLTTTDPGLTVTGTALNTTEAGRYSFTRDSATGIAYIEGLELTEESAEGGITTFSVSAGPLKGLSIEVADGLNSANIDLGRSLMGHMETQVTSWLSSSGTLSRRENAINEQISDDAMMLEDLDTEAESIESIYLQQFTQMELIVTQLNSTGDYLTSLIDAWNADN